MSRPSYKRYVPEPAHWSNFGEPAPGDDAHFQSFQFDRTLDGGSGRPRHPGLSPEGNRVIHGDKSLRAKVAMLLTTPCGIFQAAAFRCR